MNTKRACILLLAVLVCSVEAYEDENKENAAVEARGKAKYALLIHFFYVVATKLFVLKMVYGAIFYALVIKGWHFVNWFIHYLKEKKTRPHHEYIDFAHEPYHHDVHDHYDSHGHDHTGYGHDSYGPYTYDKYGYGSDYDSKRYGKKKIMYDADGSFSVKS